MFGLKLISEPGIWRKNSSMVALLDWLSKLNYTIITTGCVYNYASSPFKEGGYYLIKYSDTAFLIYTALQNRNRSFHSCASISVLEFLALYIIIYTQSSSNQVKNMHDTKKTLVISFF